MQHYYKTAESSLCGFLYCYQGVNDSCTTEEMLQ